MQTDLLHVSIYIYDVEATVKFYSDLFDAEVLFTKTMPDKALITMLKIGGFELEAIRVPDEAERISLMNINKMTPNHFALEVEDIELAMENISAAGAEAEDEPRQIELPPGTPAKIAFIHGPSGERIELYQKV